MAPAKGSTAALLCLLTALAVPALTAAPPAAAQGTGVFVVGDSLEVGTGPYLQRYLPGLSVRVDADESRSSSAALEVVRARTRPSDGVVVLDVGSNNDPSQTERLAGDLSEAAELIGDRCLVLVTLTRPPYNGISFEGLNDVMSSFAAQRPNTQLVDWDSYATAQPGLLHRDSVHATATGYDLRARLIADGVQACVTAGSAYYSPPAPSQQAVYDPGAAQELQRALRDRATSARLLAMDHLRRAWRLTSAHGSGAAAFLIDLVVFTPHRPGARPAASRRSGAPPGSRRRSPPRRSP
jgi:hypothetical protein